MSLFHFGLRTGGVLFLGPSESPGELLGGVRGPRPALEDFTGKRRDIRPPGRHALRSRRRTSRRSAAPAAMPSGGFDTTLAAAYDRLLDKHMPPGLLVTDRRQLDHSFGEASRYLAMRTGRTTTDVLDLVSEDLKLPLAGASSGPRRTRRRSSTPASALRPTPARSD